MKKYSSKRLLAIVLSICSFATGYAQQNPEKYQGGGLIVEAGGIVGTNGLNLRGVSIGIVGGYTFNRHFFLGGGFNFNNFSFGGEDGSEIAIPLFVRLNYSLLKSKITPYLTFDAGYNPFFSSTDYEISPNYRPKDGDIWIYQVKGGFYWHPEAGISIRLKKRRAVRIGIGYNSQRGEFLCYEAQGNEVEGKTRDKLGMITLRAGFTF